MNVIKYRLVGSPSGRVVRVRVTQGKNMPTRSPNKVSPRVADKVMLNKGYVRAGVRA